MVFEKIKLVYKLIKIFFLKPIFLHIHCIYNNLGDISVAKATIEIFRRFTPLEYSYNSKSNIIINRFLRSKRIINCLGGGTLIFSPVDSEWFISFKQISNLKNSVSFTFGTGVRDPIFFEDIDQNVIKEWISVLCKCKLVSVRGEISKKILDKFRINNVKVIGDPAIYFSRNKISFKKFFKRIGINISQNHQFFNNSKHLVLQTTLNLISELLNCNWEITLFPTCSEDLVLAERIACYFKSTAVKIFRNYFNTNLFIDNIAQQDVFVGVKLHSIILAFCSYTPSLMITYQPKCFDFMKTMDMESCILRSDSLDLNLLIQKIDYLYNNIEKIQLKQFELCREFKNRIISFSASVNKLLI